MRKFREIVPLCVLLFAIGIHLMGFENFFLALFGSMEIKLGDGTRYYFQLQQKQRTKRSVVSKMTITKKKRRAKHYAHLRAATDNLRESRQAGMAVYAPGIAMVPSVVEDPKTKICSRCNEVGHSHPWSKKCRYYQPRQRKKTSDSSAEVPISKCPSKSKVLDKDLEKDGEEQELLDSMSFDAIGNITAANFNSMENIEDKEEGKEEDNQN